MSKPSEPESGYGIYLAYYAWVRAEKLIEKCAPEGDIFAYSMALAAHHARSNLAPMQRAEFDRDIKNALAVSTAGD